jgi:hypothetical protein
MAAQKSVRRKRAKKRTLAKRDTGVAPAPTRAQKRSVIQSLGAIKNDAQNIELKIKQVLDTLIEVDFEDL